MINVIFDIFITNEYGVEVKVTDDIHNYKENRRVGRLYNICEFILVDHDLPRSISQDGELRIRVERNIGGTSYSDLYLIDDLKVNHRGQINIMGKTVGAKLFEPYMLPVAATLNHNTYSGLFEALLGSISHIMYLSPIPNSTAFYEISNDTYGSVIVDLAKKLGIDVYVKNGQIVFESMKTISANSVPVESFTQADGITASLSNTNSNGVGIVSINLQNADVSSEISMALSVAFEPQPVRPPTVRTWIDPQTSDEYSIVPQDCRMALFFNPLDVGTPDITGASFALIEGYYYVEEFDLVEESCVQLLGGILNIAGVTITDGSETTYTSVATAQYYNDTAGSDTLVFSAIPGTDDLSDDNGFLINILESGVDQSISSILSGSGSELDPYVYDVLLGVLENVPAAPSVSKVSIASMYSYSAIEENLTLTSKDSDASLNGHVIKVDGTGSVQTSGYAHSAGETVFYLDPEKVYDSIAKVVYSEIENSETLPFSAIIDNFQTDLEVRPKQEIQICDFFANGVNPVYNGQRDGMAISDFIKNDPNIDGLLTVSESTDTSNPTTLPPTMVLDGGVGDASKINLTGNPFTFEKNHNVICFEKPISGTLRIGYTTNALVTTIPNSEFQKNIPLKATFVDSFLKHTHKIRAMDYFPLSYTHRLDIADVWSIDDITARYKEISIYRVDNYSGLETSIGTKYADSTGILMLHLGTWGYGQYALKTAGVPMLYIRYYANKYDISFDKIIIKEAEVTEC